MYLIDEDKVIDYELKNVGSKDSSITGNNWVLLEGLKQMYDAVLARNGLTDANISNLYASGMVTSPFGIKEVPHLKVPVDRAKLKVGIYKHYEDIFFKRNINLIPGVKSVPPTDFLDKHNIFEVNSMRGEEVEIFGILSCLNKNIRNSNMAIVLPGSHTQIARIQNEEITDLVSMMSGELFYAISTSTIISSSIDKNFVNIDFEMVKRAFEIMREYGFNKAVYVINTMRIFDVADKDAKTSFLEGIIFGGDVICLEKYLKTKWFNIDNIVIYSNKIFADIYKFLLEIIGLDLNVMIFKKTKERDLAVKGFLEIIQSDDKRGEPYGG